MLQNPQVGSRPHCAPVSPDSARAQLPPSAVGGDSDTRVLVQGRPAKPNRGPNQDSEVGPDLPGPNAPQAFKAPPQVTQKLSAGENIHSTPQTRS